MLDLSHIPNNQENIKVFYSTGDANAWQTWQKPRKCQWVWIMCIGGGGGGGGGVTSNLPYSTGGGSGAVTRAMFNASHLPDTLYIQIGLGGAGGNGANGSAGSRSNVSILPNATSTNVVLASGNTAAVGGKGDGTGTSAAGETGMTSTVAPFATLANFISTIGITAVGAINLQAPNLIPLTSQIVTAGGGGSSYNPLAPVILSGGSILSSSISPLIQAGAGTNTSGSSGERGADGITSWKPFFSTGGAGGGTAISGSGGNGGDGGIGSGGGAGGAGNTSLGYIPGIGGKGGDGLVVIIAF